MFERFAVFLPRARTQGLRWTERCLFGCGFVLLGVWLMTILETTAHQTLETRRLMQAVQEHRGTDTTPEREPAPPPHWDLPLGHIQIPERGVSAIINPGVDDQTLQRAVGHMTGTALPGEKGNVVLAGHRDTFFRGLEGVRKKDRIRITTPRARFTYVVESIRVVAPNRIDVLEPSDEPTLTLITCYPFNYLGRAPERFIVTARLAK